MKIVLSLSGDGGADYPDHLTNLGYEVKDKSVYACSFYSVLAGTRSVVDCYRGGQAAIELQVRARTRRGDPCDFSTVYQIDVGTFQNMTGELQQRCGNGPLERDRTLQHDLDQSVLVGVIEVAEDGKERRHGSVRSVVRLNALDRLTDGQTEFLDTPVLRPKVIGSVVDQECRFPLVGRWVRLEFVNRNRVDEVIERRTQVVDRVTEQQGPSLERGRLQDRKNDAVACAVAIDLLRDCVRVFLHPSVQFLIEKASMFVRPIDLGENAV